VCTNKNFVFNGVFRVRTHLSFAHLVQRVLLISRSLMFGFMERGSVSSIPPFMFMMSFAFLINECF
jgi:hypothetical protein